jgi:hypothetical protein
MNLNIDFMTSYSSKNDYISRHKMKNTTINVSEKTN